MLLLASYGAVGKLWCARSMTVAVMARRRRLHSRAMKKSTSEGERGKMRELGFGNRVE